MFFEFDSRVVLPFLKENTYVYIAEDEIVLYNPIKRDDILKMIIKIYHHIYSSNFYSILHF
jgi:hypothetical protein